MRPPTAIPWAFWPLTSTRTRTKGEDLVEQEPRLIEGRGPGGQRGEHCCGPEDFRYGAHAVELARVPAVLKAPFPGMEDGNAVANLLYGKVNPSGKLPMTFGATEREAAFATEEQYPGTRQDTGKPGGPGPYGNGSDQLIAKYTEGLEMGYRWYEANDVKPLFPFGYGLSYTTFKYDDLKVNEVPFLRNKQRLFFSLSGIDVSFSITNTGDVAGAEAAQVYLTLPDEAGQPTKRLVNFQKVDLEPGESQQVTVRINQADSNHPFSYFIPEDPDNLGNWADGEWATVDGKYSVHVGGSSADTPLEKDIPLNFKLNKDNGKGNIDDNIGNIDDKGNNNDKGNIDDNGNIDDKGNNNGKGNPNNDFKGNNKDKGNNEWQRQQQRQRQQRKQRKQRK